MRKLIPIILASILLFGCTLTNKSSVSEIDTRKMTQAEIKDYTETILPKICFLLCGQQECDMNNTVEIDSITYKKILDDRYDTEQKLKNEFMKYFTKEFVSDYFKNTFGENDVYIKKDGSIYVNNISTVANIEKYPDAQCYQNPVTKKNIIELYTVPDGIKNIIQFYFEVNLIDDKWKISKATYEILDPHAMMSVESVAKPVIYLYPEKVIDVTVKLDLNGTLGCTYPAYPKDGWQVKAYPDGKLIVNGEEYDYLFWEGDLNTVFTFDKGFCVKGSDTAAFLKKALSEMGLIPSEYNDFIVYWLPKMENNAYNLISFIGSEYTDNAKLEITPKPDSVLRVAMAYQPLEKLFEIAPQTFEKFERNGFTVVEWGGAEID